MPNETSFRLVNGAEIVEKMKKVGPLAVKAVRSEFIRIGNDLVKSARSNHRFNNQSNQLENSIQYNVSGDGMKLEFNAGVSLAQQYAASVHDGHGTWLRDPFMQSTWDQVTPTMAGRLEAAIGKAIGAE